MMSLIICADDYAQSASIDAGILSLIRMGRITATSCLTLSPRWHESAKNITSDIRNKADIGVHIDFTQYNHDIKKNLSSLILKSYARLLPVKAIRLSIKKQLERFETALGTAPDYVDGHQHVHQLPQIREALIEELELRYASKRPWIRVAKPPVHDGIKAIIIGMLGADCLKKHAAGRNFRYTQKLLGVYNFDSDLETYHKQLSLWLETENQSSRPLALMCHPAWPLSPASSPPEANDPIHAARLVEYEVIASESFRDILVQHQVELVRGVGII